MSPYNNVTLYNNVTPSGLRSCMGLHFSSYNNVTPSGLRWCMGSRLLSIIMSPFGVGTVRRLVRPFGICFLLFGISPRGLLSNTELTKNIIQQIIR